MGALGTRWRGKSPKKRHAAQMSILSYCAFPNESFLRTKRPDSAFFNNGISRLWRAAKLVSFYWEKYDREGALCLRSTDKNKRQKDILSDKPIFLIKRNAIQYDRKQNKSLRAVPAGPDCIMGPSRVSEKAYMKPRFPACGGPRKTEAKGRLRIAFAQQSCITDKILFLIRAELSRRPSFL